MKISKISKEAAQKEITEKKVKGKWTQIINEVIESKAPVKVEELTRGQVAALYRAASNAGLDIRANYKEQYVILSAKAKV